MSTATFDAVTEGRAARTLAPSLLPLLLRVGALGGVLTRAGSAGPG